VDDELYERSGRGTGRSDLRRELRVLWGHRWLIVVTTLVFLGLAAAYTFLRTPIYTATSKVLVKPTGVNPADIGAAGNERLVNIETEAELVQSEAVANLAADELGEDAMTASLLKRVSVGIPANSQILEVSCSDPRPEKATACSRAFANAYLAYRSEQAVGDLKNQTKAIDEEVSALNDEIAEQNEILQSEPASSQAYQDAESRKSDLQAQIFVLTSQKVDLSGINTDPGSVVSEAQVPTKPSSPNHELDFALGLFAGVFGGIGLSFLKQRTDNKIRERHQLEATIGAPVLAVIPRVEGWRRRDEAKLITMTDPLAPAAEAYRVLRPVLLAAAADRGVKVVMVASAMAGEGKSTTAANLSVVLTQAGRRVALLTADLRRPRAHEFFEVRNEPGISDVLTGNAELAEIAQRCDTVGGDLWIYAAGRQRAHPAELLQSRQMQRILEDLRESYDFVILDCPPVLAVSDALPLIPLSDGVLFVTDAESTTREQVALSRDRLVQMGARVLGAIINALPSTSASYYDYRGSYGYGYTDANGNGNGNGNGSKRSRRASKTQSGS
jgi:capsular exopolysaccharide synthesis family protein